MKPYEIEVARFFDAAHQLPDSDDLITKKCTNLHGHTYQVIVFFHGHSKDSGMVLDFKAVTQTIDKLDHRLLNDIIKIPTAENVAKYIYDEIAKYNPAILSLKVKVGEGYKGQEHTNYVTYESGNSENT